MSSEIEGRVLSMQDRVNWSGQHQLNSLFTT